MRVAESITEKLTTAFRPLDLRVVDESHHHAGHAGARPGGETHFAVVIVSDSFAGKSRVERQRLVYGALAAELAGQVHALSLTTLTADEAAKRAGQEPV
jgi:BolA protein